MHKLSILSHFPLGGGLSYLRGADCFSAETNLASWDDFGQRRRQKAASIAGTTQDHVQGGRAPASVNRNSVRVLSVVPVESSFCWHIPVCRHCAPAPSAQPAEAPFPAVRAFQVKNSSVSGQEGPAGRGSRFATNA